MNTEHVTLAVTALHPHPNNPRIEPRQDVVDQLAARIADGFDPAHALIVRPLDDGYQIVSGHHRWLAAQQAGLPSVPCWVRELSDADAYMQLVLCNTQSELHALEEGKHAAESGMDLKAYAEVAGKNHKTMHTKVRAWNVLHATHLDIEIEDARRTWSNLAEIHAAPRWLWSALVAKMVETGWTVAQTRERVQGVKGIEEPRACFDRGGIAAAVLSGAMKPAEIARMHDVIDQHGVRDGDLTSAMFAKIANTLPARLSAVRAIVAGYEDEQSKIDAAARAEEVERQRAEEDAQARVVSLRRNCSLDEWKDIGDDERNMLLTPLQSEGGAFNKQDNDAIEWAQWSWNPVTGCKHDCPYCYARDIALSQRMAKVYPNGFAPTFRSNALNAPARTKVPKDAAADTRHRNVFTCSMADLFGRWVPAEWIDAVLGTVRDSAEWNFLFLTKFPQRMKEFDIPDNAWMGATVDMQARVKNAENAFENVGGKVRWLSVEPLIEPLRFERLDLFDWLVIGGASSSTQTPAWHPPYRWIEDLVRQADAAGVPVYMKSNLGIANRVLDLPFDAPIKRDPQQAPNEFRYLGNT